MINILKSPILFLLIILSFNFNINVQAQNAPHETVYVSSTGNDTNDGSQYSPFRSISRAIKSKPQTILLHRGDTFYEAISLDGINIDAYGEGEAPVLSGLRVLKSDKWERGKFDNKGKWKKSKSGQIWRINLADPTVTEGGYSSIKGSSQRNNIGGIVNVASHKMYDCMRVGASRRLSQNFDFWQDTQSYTQGFNNDSLKYLFDYLYVMYDGDIRNLRLGVSVGASCISAKNCSVKNLNIEFWGWHGIDGGSNLTVDNCTIDYIGGRLTVTTTDGGCVCLGNGIEFYIKPPNKHDCIVTNCTVRHCFDAGMTIQGSSEQEIQAINIVFRNNKFYNCCQSYEEFLRGATDMSKYINCIFENNYSKDAGINTGFRYSDGRYKRCHILGNSFLRPTGMIYRNNIFENGNFFTDGPYDGKYNQAIWEGNVCYIWRGQDLLGSYRGDKLMIKVPLNRGDFANIEEATQAAINEYRSLTGDRTTRFVILE